MRSPYPMILGGALLAGATACEPPMPARHDYFEASFPPIEPRPDWGRVDPELVAAGIRLHVELGERPAAHAPLERVDRSLDLIATSLDRLPAGAHAPVVARAAQHIHGRARTLAEDDAADERRIDLIKDCLTTAAWAMLVLTDHEYAPDPEVRGRVARFRERVETVGLSDVGHQRFDVYDALLGGRDALDGFQLAIARGSVRWP